MKTARKPLRLLLAIAATAVLGNSAVWAQSLGQLDQAMDPKHKKIVLVNNQSSAADVFINFGADSKINVSNLGGFCDSQSIAPLNCHHTLAANNSEELPNPDFKYVNLALAFNHVVDCGATKAEVIANNPNWYDIMDVSVVDGFNNKIEIDATEPHKPSVILGPPAGMTGNQTLFGVYPYECTICADLGAQPCQMNGNKAECHAGTESNPIPPCQYQMNPPNGKIEIILQP